MAAGMGSRYGGIKQIDPVGPSGETIIDYSIFDALRAGFGRLVFVIRRDIEAAFREAIGSRFEHRAQVDYVFQELDALPDGFSVPPDRTKPWGTGHAVLSAAGAIDVPFAVINGDDFYGRRSFHVLAEHLRSTEADHAMVGFVLRNTLSPFGSVSRGVCRVSATGILQEVTEQSRIERQGDGARFIDTVGISHPLTGSETVSMNMWGFTPAIFGHIREQLTAFLTEHGRDQKAELLIPTVVSAIIGSGQARCVVLPTTDVWFGVTYREDRPVVIDSIRRLVAQGDYPESLWG